MEMVLGWRVPVMYAVPWRRLIRACTSLALVCMLYCCIRTCTEDYGNEAQEIKVSDKVVPTGQCRERADVAGTKRNASVNSPMLENKKNIELKIARKQETAEETSAAGEYTITEEMPVIEKSDIIEDDPEQESAIISETKNISLADEEEISVEESGSLREIGGFFVDGEGYITGTADSLDLLDGVLVLPSGEKCIGVKSGAFSDIGEDVIEIFIPANIFDIEEGAFADFITLMYVEVAEENPYYSSMEGILCSKSGEIIMFPAGR